MNTTRLRCWSCNQPVTTPIDGDVMFRGLAYCVECVESGRDTAGRAILDQMAERIAIMADQLDALTAPKPDRDAIIRRAILGAICHNTPGVCQCHACPFRFDVTGDHHCSDLLRAALGEALAAVGGCDE
jgi:hypothetical protein